MGDASRLFVAIEIGQDAGRLLAECATLARQAGLRGSWGAARNPHLTVAFLGDVPCDMLSAAAEAVAEAARPAVPFALKTGETGAFPSLDAARVLFVSLADPPEGLFALVESTRRALAARALPFDRKPFSPHLTFGRLDPPANARRLRAPRLGASFEARALVLFESELSPGGALHRPLSRADFGGRPAGS